jgi:hypothetical protein
VLAASAGTASLLVAGIGLGAGLAYDLRLKGTRWSWLPYAVGIPLLPLFGWVGAVGSVPPAFAVLLPVAVVAGAALAVANALADLERDERAGTETVATILGTGRARRAGALLQAAVVVAALGSALALGGARRRGSPSASSGLPRSASASGSAGAWAPVARSGRGRCRQSGSRSSRPAGWGPWRRLAAGG